MLLTVDIGNTKIKAAVFEVNALKEKFVFEKNETEKKIKKIFEQHEKIASVILSSVGNREKEIVSELKKYAPVTVIDHEFSFPFINKYTTPATLGVDRMVLAAGAVLQFPDQNRLVLDAGTCITYDFVDRNNHYLGGAISPGLQMRYDAMHNFTAKLPLLYPETPSTYIGDSTNSSLHSGAVNGFVYEIEGFIKEYSRDYEDLTVILTGGDAEFLAKRLKNTIFANSNFLLESLNNLYIYKIKND
ncbi:type III pantothenate kinase [Flavobacterium alkalisoli]|uniref:Type III pantothenate kinase n=1 Tax=Flavobacterium alkalisoli TaxID=2602769 RepID=A0A5B9FWX0_9FLAO|nr:type III pantothenate kinase [Flavobacterium alkalisoli]QEE49222.1 type III pantothenate kinase [Flavobacterium alkalisoli]